MIETLNLATGEKRTYSGITPREAVIAAYAQGTMGDYNTWDYPTKYGAMVETGLRTVLCGDWTAKK